MYQFPPPIWTNQDWKISRLLFIVLFGLILPVAVAWLTRRKPWMATIWVVVGTIALCSFGDYFAYGTRTYEPYRYMMALPCLLTLISAVAAMRLWWQSTDGAARLHEGIVIALILFVLVTLALPGVTTTAWTAHRQVCRNNVKQLGLAFYNYHDKHGTFPPASLGQPAVSWRIAMLPYLDQAALAQQYDWNQSWDSISNARLQKERVAPYSCRARPSEFDSKGRFLTAYIVPTATSSIFDSDTGTSFSEIKDGSSNTLLAMEACGTEIIWTEPRDVDSSNAKIAVNAPGSVKGLSGSMISSWHTNGAHIAMADGSVRFIETNTDPELLRKLITKSGEEEIEEW